MKVGDLVRFSESIGGFYPPAETAPDGVLLVLDGASERAGKLIAMSWSVMDPATGKVYRHLARDLEVVSEAW